MPGAAPCSDCGGCPSAQIACGDDRTCNKWCFPGKKQYSRACDCPCPCKRNGIDTGFPPDYFYRIDNIYVVTMWTSGSDPTETYVLTSSAGPFAWNSCIGWEPDGVAPTITFNHFSSGVLVDSGVGGLTLGGNGTGSSPTDCETGFNYSLGCSLTGATGPAGGVNLAIDLENRDKCSANETWEESAGNNFWASGGIATRTAVCAACDGTPLQTDTGDPASLCAAPLTLSGFFSTGDCDGGGNPVYEFLSVVLTQSECTWTGAAAGISATVYPDPAHDCGDGCDEGNNTRIYLCDITTDHGSIRLSGGTDSCPLPDMGWSEVSDTLPICAGWESSQRYHDLTSSYGTDCP